MITNVCLLLEMLSIVLCLHRLYGEKFRFDIVTVSFVCVYDNHDSNKLLWVT